MSYLTYHKENVVDKTWIRLKSPESMEAKHIIVASGITGKSLLFDYDSNRTESLGARHEWWDGEESHRIYNENGGSGITLEIWATPYD